MSALTNIADGSEIAPGSVVVVRDEEWLVTGVTVTTDGQLLDVQGLSDLVRGTSASFYSTLDKITSLDPADARLVADDSPRYRRARLWLESTLRKSPLPLNDPRLSVATRALADPLEYQQAAVRKALDPSILRPRVLLADAVGLGKTLEIGMILSELVRRGRGERILIVCPRHVLEQMQHEMWCRFALPFVRLDSIGMQRVKQKLPATRNPFTWFKRVIISIDTLKQDRFAADLRRHRWDAVIIDESHNVTNSATQNNRLARTLAPNTDALILASATPHNGNPESFAELIRLLEPTAVTPEGELIPEEVERLVIRRHRHSEQVARTVGADWAERREPLHLLVDASPAEDAVATELDEVWLHPASGESPSSQKSSTLFPWTLAKAFLSSPAAFDQTLTERRRRIGDEPTVREQQEIAALDRLIELNKVCLEDGGSKVRRLKEHLDQIGVARGSDERVVIFAERVATLTWLQQQLTKDLRMSDQQVVVLHGGLSDVEQQEVVESFKQSSSPIRVLVTGDIASEGVNLHLQCHQLVHYDIPWSLIRIEQRNGRIDRYGQRTPPQITTVVLEPSTPGFAGDIRVLSRLLEKEHQAHTALGDAASLMGKYDAGAEEEEIRRVLAGQRELDDVVADPQDVISGDSLTALLAQLGQLDPATSSTTASDDVMPLYAREIDFLREALDEIYQTPSADPSAGGVRWREHPEYGVVELNPPRDLIQRLEVLPQGYLADRAVTSTFKLATTRERGKSLLADALTDTSDSTWPEAHFLGPLHPILDWATDRALATLSRNEVFTVRGDVTGPTILLQGTLTNRRGQVVSTVHTSVLFPEASNTSFALITNHDAAAAMLASVGVDSKRGNPGPCRDVSDLQPLLRSAVHRAREAMKQVFAAAEEAAERRVAEWNDRAEQWMEHSEQLTQRTLVRSRRTTVREEQQLVATMRPDRSLVRPLLAVLPSDHPIADHPIGGSHGH